MEETYGDRCVRCGIFYPYEELHLLDTEPDEDGYLVIEIYICRGCMDEEDGSSGKGDGEE